MRLALPHAPSWAIAPPAKHAVCAWRGAGSGQAMSVEWLLHHGADATLVNDDGLTPAAIANNKKRPDIARAIDAHIENPQPKATVAAAPAAASAAPAPPTAPTAPPGSTWSFADHEEEVD